MNSRWHSGRILFPLTGGLAAAVFAACGTGFTPPEGTGGAGGVTSSTTTSSSTTLTGGSGGAVDCTAPSQCPGVDGQCQHRTCDAGVCGVAFEPTTTTCTEGGGEACNGSGACLKLDGTACASGPECTSGSCADGVCCDSACDAACQACDSAGSIGTCTPYAVSTDPEAECGAGATCNGASQCQKIDGSACGAAGECLSGFCADGVCCATECAGTCESCALAATIGTCTPHPVASDPDGECAGGTCDGSGACATGATQWIKTLGGSASEILYGLVADSAGNLFATGAFNGTINFGCGPLSGNGSDDAFVVKFDAAGTCQWQHNYGGAGSDVGRGIALDSAGNVILTGTFAGAVNFAGTNLTALGLKDVFVVKLASNGSQLWVKSYGGNEASGQETGVGVATDGANNIYVTGLFSSSITLAQTYANQGQTDAFLAKVNSAGVVLWSKVISSTGADTIVLPAVDSTGAVIIAGTHAASVNLGGSALNPGTGENLYLAKYDAGGAHLWSSTYGNSAPVSATGLAVTSTDQIAVSGVYENVIVFNLFPLTSNGAKDVFVGWFNADGTPATPGLHYGDANDQGATRLAFDAADHLILAGDLVNSVDFGNGVTLTSCGQTDAFVAKVGPTGGLWGHSWGDGAAQSAQAVAVDGSGNVFVGGYFSGTVDFGQGFVNSAGSNDIFIMKLAP